MLAHLPYFKTVQSTSLMGLCWLLLAGSALAQEGPKQALVLGLEPYFDSASDNRSRRVGNEMLVDESTDVGRSPAFGVSVTYLAPLKEWLRLGGGLRYLGNYTFGFDEEGREDDEETLGQLLEIYGKLEVRIPLTERIGLVPALEVGLPLLFPGGDLSQETESLGSQGFNLRTFPVGFMLGGELHGRFQVVDWLAARVGVGLLHERLYLYSGGTDGDVGSASRDFSIVRVRIAIGAEFNF